MPCPTDQDLWLFAEGRHERLWEVLGAFPEADGVRFSVWAPHAQAVSVATDGNGWQAGVDPLDRMEGSGVWTGVVAGARPGTPYKLAVTGADGVTTLRADPMAATAEQGGGMASVVYESGHRWGDDEWMAARRTTSPVDMRLSIYEVHLGSWRRHLDGRVMTYRELAPLLAEHVRNLGFTHVELMPVAEHPYEPSWGYQVTGYYAPTSRFGSPDDFRWFVDHLHQQGIGVIVDWVPAHFPRDAWALAAFDGTPCYEHADPRRASHPDWGTLVFDHGKPEVKAFLISNALFWMGELHCDGIRVDAVASMLYLDYSRDPGGWTPNVHGGNEALDAVELFQQLNSTVHLVQPGVLTIAEESTAWDGVSRPVDAGGLGFTHKWNMGWMHDTLDYWSRAPEHRRWHHDELTFGLTYAWAEHFVLPLSHDEVVHLKKPLLGKMPSDAPPDRFADLRALYAWMWAHPGKQLLFMGAELAERHEWSHDRSLDWDLGLDPLHAGVAALVGELNRVQRDHPALFRGDGDPDGFGWLSVDDAHHSTLAFERREPGYPGQVVVAVANLSAQDQPHYRVGLTLPGAWRTVLTTDDVRFGGGTTPAGPVEADDEPWQGRPHSTVIHLPARSVTYLAPID